MCGVSLHLRNNRIRRGNLQAGRNKTDNDYASRLNCGLLFQLYYNHNHGAIQIIPPRGSRLVTDRRDDLHCSQQPHQL